MIVQSSGGVAYEPWSFDLPNNVIGYGGNVISINTPNAQTMCDTITCTTNIATGSNGAFRFLTINPGIGWHTGIYSGTFYTDPHATTVLSSTDPMAVRQFVAPGLSISLSGMTCRIYHAQTYIMGCAGASDDQGPFTFNPFITGSN